MLEQSLQSTRRRQRALPRWQLRRVTEFIEANLHQSFRNGDLAAIVNTSTSYFARLFQRAMGESPAAYVRRRRIDRARKMMVGANESLAQIAYACGLTDQAHFTRLFRRLVGSTPAAWRREHHCDEPDPPFEGDPTAPGDAVRTPSVSRQRTIHSGYTQDT